MKRTFFIIIILLATIFAILFMKFKTLQNEKMETRRFNSEYEAFNSEKINGLDVASAIYKATSNNEKYSVQKNKEGYYDLEDNDCIEIYVIMYFDEIRNAKKYKMESLNKSGMNSFISSFGSAFFKCANVEYYENTGKIKSMTFELLD